MKKNILLLFLIITFFNANAQIPTINYDYWQSVNTYSVSNSATQDFDKSVMIEENLIMIVDTFTGTNPYNRKGLFVYNTTTRNINTLAYPVQDGDRGIKCATAYKTSTPGLTYGIFGSFSGISVGYTYPVFYTYNSLTSSFAADSINFGIPSDYEGGIANIAMFSPTTNHDTVRFFVNMISGSQVFKKHINQTSIVPTYAQIGIEYVKASIVYNNKLFVAGDSTITDYALLKESIDGNNFTQPNNINNLSFPYTSHIALLDTLDGKLIIGLNSNNGSGGYEFYSYDGTTLQLSFSDANGTITSHQNFKKRLWYSTTIFDNGSTADYAYLHSISNGASIPSVEAFGGDVIDGNYMALSATKDSLYFAGNKGTFMMSKNNSSSNITTTQTQAIFDKFLEVHKLMPPVSSFNYNNNQICLNANETFTSTSQNTDSLHWLYDGAYYASSPGPSAWMNINFPSTGNHSVGLVAFGGTFTDTTFLSVNVYSVSIAISGNTLVCLGNSFNYTSTTAGAIGTPTVAWRDYISSPLVNINTGATFSYSPTLGATAFQFFAIVTDFHGCTATSNTVNAQCNPLYQIDGQVFTGSTPTITSVSGEVTLYKYEPFLGKFDSISTTTTGFVGDFNFAAMPEGDYILKAVPSATILQTSYHGTNAISWKNATPFSHTCLNQSTKNIDVIPLENLGTGPGVLTGSVYQGNGFGNRMANEGLKPMVPGTPIGGIIVKGGKNPGGQMFVQTLTGADGTYTLTGLPVNTGDTYFILVDIPGLDTSGTYRRILTSGTSTITGLDFMVDSIYIYPIGMATSISKDNSVFNQEIKLFPNPSKELAFIEYELIESANTEIDLFDVVGQKVKTITPFSKQEKNKYKHSINLGDLSSGIYFVKVRINNSENVIKLIITN
jgi:hypothetical protein